MRLILRPELLVVCRYLKVLLDQVQLLIQPMVNLLLIFESYLLKEHIPRLLPSFSLPHCLFHPQPFQPVLNFDHLPDQFLVLFLFQLMA
jgi:hypothetical protein